MSIDRRKVLATAAAAALFPAHRLLAAEKTSVVVIGAGLSGLYTALTLQDAGADVVVLEGSKRIGGRVFTDFASEHRPEFGASQIGASYSRVVDMCARLKLPLVVETHDTPLPMSNRVNGQWVRSDQWEASPANRTVGAERAVQPAFTSATFAGKHNRLKGSQDWLDPAFADMDISLYDAMVRDGASAEAIRLADLSSFGTDIQSSSLLAISQEATRGAIDRAFATQTGLPNLRKIAGGASALTNAMAAALGDRVRTGKIVSAIDMGGAKAEVSCLDGSRFKADFVVAAIPFSLLRAINITPQMPPVQAKAVNFLPSGYTSRGFGVISGDYWT